MSGPSRGEGVGQDDVGHVRRTEIHEVDHVLERAAGLEGSETAFGHGEIGALFHEYEGSFGQVVREIRFGGRRRTDDRVGVVTERGGGVEADS